MSEPTTLADLIGTDPLPADQVRKCKQCAQVKPFAASHWRTEPNGKPRGWMCKACDSARSSRKARRRTEIAKALRLAAKTGQVDPRGPDVPATMVGARNMVARQLDATEALRHGVRHVNDYAGRVLAKVFEYAMDPTSPHHEWALKLVADRVMPAKMFAEMGLLAAGGAQSKTGPTVQIMVMPAQPAPEAVPAAITVRAIEEGASDESAA